MAKILDSICQPNDIKNVPPEQYAQLAGESGISFWRASAGPEDI